MTGLLLGVSVAAASSCCVGSTSDQPAQLGRCERFGAGFGVGEVVELGRIDGEGGWAATAEGWSQTTTSLGVAGRWARWGSVGLAVPFVVNAQARPGENRVGMGFGDVSAAARIEPWEEVRGPVPVFTVGLVAPSGTGWFASNDPLGADVTGGGEWAPVVGVALERTSAAWPWRVGVEAAGLQRWVGSASIGRSFAPRWTAALAVSGRAETSTAGVSWRSGLDARVVLGRPAAWRVWASAGSDLPVGRSAHLEARGGAGVVFVR